MTANVGEISEAEIPQVAEFLARQVSATEAITVDPPTPVERLRWLLLENPARSADIPFGWRVLGEGGAVVATAICIPMKIRSGGAALTSIMFCKFYVDVPYRGVGVDIFMQFLAMRDMYPLFCPSTNAVAGEIFSKLGALPISGLDHTMLGIARAKPLLDEWLFRRSGLRLGSRLMSSLGWFLPGHLRAMPAPAELIPASSADELASIGETPADEVTAIVRDRNYLHWRFFTGQRDKQAYRCRQPGEPDRLVVVNQTRAGYRGQIRVLNVLDIWPPTSAQSAPAICAALALRYARRFDTIWLRSQPPASENALAGVGFVRHAFPAQLGWYFDSENRLSSKTWYVMPGESE